MLRQDDHTGKTCGRTHITGRHKEFIEVISRAVTKFNTQRPRHSCLLPPPPTPHSPAFQASSSSTANLSNIAALLWENKTDTTEGVYAYSFYLRIPPSPSSASRKGNTLDVLLVILAMLQCSSLPDYTTDLFSRCDNDYRSLSCLHHLWLSSPRCPSRGKEKLVNVCV